MSTPSRLAARLALAAVLAAPALAAAQPGETAAEAPRPPPRAPVYDELDPETAFAASLGFTAAGYLTAVLASKVDDSDTSGALAFAATVGITLGPTTGHWYSGDIATRGLALRALGMTLGIIGIENLDGSEGDSGADGEAVLLTGLALFAIGTIDDIATAPGKARQKTERNRARALRLTVAPRVTAQGAGLVLGGRF